MASILRNCPITRFLSLGITALLTISLTACGGGAGTVGIASGIALFTTAPAAVGIPVGATVNYSIGGGTPIYTAHSSNPSVTNASIGGDRTSLSIRGLSSGVSEISIRDAAGATVTISVTVGNGGTTAALFTTAPSAVTINPGGTASFNIGGGTAPYQSSTSNASVATTGITGATLNIIGVAAGVAQIVVLDASGASVTIDVTVGSGTAVALFTSAPGALTLGLGVTAPFTIGGGKPAYLVSSSNAAVATVGINGSTFIISGIAAGTAQVAVVDSTGTAVTINVTVGSGGTTTALYTTAASAVTVAPGAATTFNIGGGTAPYTATSSNTTVATTGVSGTVLSLNGVAAGTAQVLVFDATGASVAIGVTVGTGGSSPALFTTAPGAVTLAIGTASPYAIGGGTAPYAGASSNGNVATATVAGATLTVTGVGAGTAQVLVFDATGTSVTIAVTVGSGGTSTALFTTAPSAVTLAIGATNSFTIGGGSAPYLATSSNTSVVNATGSGTSLAIFATGPGTAQVLVFDATGASVAIDVTVPQPAATPPTAVSVLPDGATGNVGDVMQFLVSGGSPAYTVSVTNPSIATVSPASVAASGASFSATLLNAGSTNITIIDALGQSASVALTVSQTSTLLRLSPSALLIAEDSTNAIALNIFGGTGPYSAFTSDQTLSSVGASGSILTVSLGTNLNRCINPIDSSGVRVPNGTFDVTITVVDSLGASATSIMTLKDNGIGTGSVAVQPAPFVAPCT